MHLYALFFIELVLLFFLSRKITRKIGSFVFRLTKSEKWTRYIMSILFLPGTFVHEVSHFLSALILLVPVRQIELTPRVEEGRVNMGRVPIGKVDFVRRTLVGISPLIFGVSLIIATLYFLTSKGLISSPSYVVLAGYLVFEIGNTMYLSRKDLEGAWLFFVVLALLLVALYLFGFRFSAGESVFASEGILDVVRTGSVYLSVPILIDIALLFLLSLIRRV
jgi:hypothetical protein